MTPTTAPARPQATETAAWPHPASCVICAAVDAWMASWRQKRPASRPDQSDLARLGTDRRDAAGQPEAPDKALATLEPAVGIPPPAAGFQPGAEAHKGLDRCACTV